MAAKEVAKLGSMIGKDKVPIVVADTGPFLRSAGSLFDDEELERLRDHVAMFRELGDVIRNTGGLRKLRWATANNRGKSHGARVIYYYGGDHMPVYLIAAYGNGQRATLSEAAKKAARKFVAELKRAHEPQLRRDQLRVIDGQKQKKRPR